MNADTKVIIISAKNHGFYDDVDVRTSSIVIEDSKTLGKEMAELLANDPAAIEQLLDNQWFVKALDQKGFRDINKINDLNEKVKLGGRFYISENHRIGACFHAREIGLDNITRYNSEQLAQTSVSLFQEIDKDSLKTINPEAYKEVEKAKRRLRAAEAVKLKRKQEAADKKHQKEIEKAKKILKDNGHI